MIYLSAQPDQYYFLWQLKLQLFNFIKLGIKHEQIHILVGFDTKKGVSQEFKEFKEKNPEVNIHFYEDTRKNNLYLSSLRPHIILKHFQAFEFLQNEIVFYHDSDIVFSRLPAFEDLINDDTWYVSDTRFYLDSNYIKSKGDENLFYDMCNIIKVDPVKVLETDNNAGGAQYLLKNCDIKFWQKNEMDCETLFKFLSEYKTQKVFFGKTGNKTGLIDAWLTDMWVMWWNAIFFNKNFKIHSELDFSWAYSDVKEWKSKRILHYTGGIALENKSLFRKSNYFFYEPFLDDFTQINKKKCSYPLVRMIKVYNKFIDQLRVDLKDVTFLMSVKVDSQDRLDNIYAVTKYLCTHFKTKILLLEADKTPKLKRKMLHQDITYVFVKDKNLTLDITKYNNFLINEAKTPYISIYHPDVILPVQQVVKSVMLLRNSGYSSILPYNGNCYEVDMLLKTIFIKILDDKFLIANKNKQSKSLERIDGDCIFFKKSIYIKTDCDDEKLECYETENTGCVKRVRPLGHETKRINGPLFHLYHEMVNA